MIDTNAFIKGIAKVIEDQTTADIKDLESDIQSARRAIASKRRLLAFAKRAAADYLKQLNQPFKPLTFPQAVERRLSKN